MENPSVISTGIGRPERSPARWPRGCAISRRALADGYVMTDPYPTAYDISAEPLRSARDMALILSTDWQLPPELRDAFPSPPEMPDDLPPDVVY